MPLTVDDRDLVAFLRHIFGDPQMPKKLHGKKLTAKQHRQWKHVRDSQRARGLSDAQAAASATAAVKRSRKKKQKK